MSNLKRKFASDEEMPSIPDRSKILDRKLSLRPDRHQLIEQGILHDSQCAPRLQLAEQALKRARLADDLNQRLSNRPGPMDLIEKNILCLQPNSTDDEATNAERTKPIRRPLIFHEYTASPTSSKPKITKVDASPASSASTSHQIRLAQQQLYLELTTNKSTNSNVDATKFSSIEDKPLEQLTLNQLKDLCRMYHLPSSHANKSQLIQRISAHRSLTDELPTTMTSDEIDYLSPAELDEILRSFPPSTTLTDDDETNFFDQFFSQIVDPQSMSNHQDDLFVQMLLDSPSSTATSSSTTTTTTTTFPPEAFVDERSSASPLPRITTLDEFDAFLRDFTSHQRSTSFQQISTSTN